MLNAKIKTIKQLKPLIYALRRKGKKVVFTNGCFDILHYGHAKYLEEAKKKGDILVVGVNSDASVKRIKGDKRPIISQNDRLGLIAALESVDYAFLFKEGTPLKAIMALHPAVLIKGADWQEDKIVGADFIKAYRGRVARIKLLRNRSTSSIIKKIAENY
jgi:D-beta-D-heptose 7-phosphate kinase/D-beta-D-heptose 1-phosphate adenosyltransferase